MIELLKGLIGAELTLMGVPNHALPDSVAAAPERTLPRIDARGLTDLQETDRSSGDVARVEFSASDYRTAAG